MADSELAVCEDGNNCTSLRGPLDLPMARRNWIDSEITNEKALPKVSKLDTPAWLYFNACSNRRRRMASSWVKAMVR